MRLRFGEELISNPLSKYSIEINEKIMDIRAAAAARPEQQPGGKGAGRGKGKRGRGRGGGKQRVDESGDEDEDEPPQKGQKTDRKKLKPDGTELPLKQSTATKKAFDEALKKHGMKKVNNKDVYPCGFAFAGTCKFGKNCSYWHK